MNGTNPPSIPPSGPVETPQTAGLAIWSLVLGILGLTCLSIFGAIPAVICGHKAINRIEKSSGTLGGKGMAIGGLITGYIGIALGLFCIPMLAAIAVPNCIKARDTSMKYACINNLRQIYAAKEEWALENSKPADAVPTENDLTPYLANHQMPHCPAGGVYTLGAVTNAPTCSIPTHELPDNPASQ